MRQVPQGIRFVLLTTLLFAAVPVSTGAGTYLTPMPPQPDGRLYPPPVPARPPAQARVVKVPPLCARSLPPRPLCDGRPVPVPAEDPGPVKPILYHGVSLIGSVVAAPFRLLEMFVDYAKKKTCRPSLAPCTPTCGPPLSARIIQDLEYPPVEPRGLASGIRHLPSRIRSRGRIAGDLPRKYGHMPCSPYAGR
jgi:hypothetical protein